MMQCQVYVFLSETLGAETISIEIVIYDANRN